MLQRSKTMNLREIVVIASISVVFGVLYLAWIIFGQFIKGIFGPIAHGAISGVWIMAPVLCAYIIRKPGVALLAEMIAAGTEVLVGSVNAGVILIVGFTQGLGAELAFALFLYRSYRLPVLMLAGMFGMVANYLTFFFIHGYSEFAYGVRALMVGVMLISGATIAGWGSKKIADALSRTGVLNNFALGRINQKKRMEENAISHDG